MDIKQTSAAKPDHQQAPGAWKKRYFSEYKKPKIEMPNLIQGQLDSFQWLISTGIKEVFEEFGSITDYSGKKFELNFKDFRIEQPKITVQEAKFKNDTYEAPLKVTASLTNKTFNSTKEQEIFMTDFPMMTTGGSFIVNGVERVVVPQLARSFGVLFNTSIVRGREMFGAKIIPNRGVWIEIETDHEEVMFVRVDKNRKFPITTLLRVFGAETNSDIEELFKDNEAALGMIKKTLAKEGENTRDEAYLDMYKRLRDGDLATLDNARDFIISLFGEERYDLSRVGRYKFNNRFDRATDDKTLDEERQLSLDDFVTIIDQVGTLNNTADARPDDIDHLGSRRVRFVGEILQQKFRTGMAQMKRNIQNRMSTIESDTSLPVSFISPRPLQARIKEFFNTNQLSQFMQQENVLAEVEHLRTVSAMGPGGLTRERAGLEVRDVHPSHYGRLCPIHTPEGPNIGLILRFTGYARTNRFGMLETPYHKVAKGVVSKEIVYLNGYEEEKHTIAHAANPRDDKDAFLAKEVDARRDGKPVKVPKGEIDLCDVSATQAFSIATSMIPFLNNDDANRTLMASNMQKQAVPCIRTEAPLVGTGFEEKAMIHSTRLIRSEEDGKVTAVDGRRVVVKSGSKEKEYPLINYERTNNFTAFTQRPVVSLGETVKKGTLLADASSTDHGQMALGQNMLIAFMSWSGSNYEDAIIISERVVKDAKFTSIHLEEIVVNVRDTKLGPEVTTYDIPNVSEAKLRNLDEDGIVRVGAEVRSGDILVGKITPKGETQLTPEERLLRSIFGDKARDVKDTSKRVEGGKKGRVVGIKVFSRENGDKLESGIIKKIFIEVAQLRNVSVGDKLAGRHGNKGVISRILPEEDMPYMDDGTPVDVILTPLGVPSRMNLGQILEMHLGLAANSLGYQAMAPAFGAPTTTEIKEELVKAGFNESGKMPLFDGRTGDKFEQDIAVGYMYILKLHHMVADKIHMRSIGPYSLITQQPLGGKSQNGGQRFGEMEVWALLGYGVAHILREILTIKSDDIQGRSAAFDSIVHKRPIEHSNSPASFTVLLHNLRGLGLNMQLGDEAREDEA